MMILRRLLTVFVFATLLTGCDDVKKIREEAELLDKDIQTLKTDIKLLRNFLQSIPTPSQCPDPGEHTARICHYTLKILEPMPKHEHWYKVTIPTGVIEKAQADCEKVRANFPDLANYPCSNPKKYKHWEYAIYVEGKIEAKKSYSFVNDPVTNHLIVIQEVS